MSNWSRTPPPRGVVIVILWVLLTLGTVRWGATRVSAEEPRASGSPRISELVERYSTDRSALTRFYSIPLSPTRLERLERFDRSWRLELEELDFEGLSLSDQIDSLLLRQHIDAELARIARNRERLAEIQELLPFATTIIALEESRWRGEEEESERAATQLEELREQVSAVRKRLQKGLDEKQKKDKKKEKKDKKSKQEEGQSRAEGDPRTDANEAAGDVSDDADGDNAASDDADAEALTVTPSVASRTARAVGQLRKALETWYRNQKGYVPEFDWWVREPYERADKALKNYAGFLSDKLRGPHEDGEDPLVGDPIGRDALREEITREWLPYTPEELLAIAQHEFDWCEKQQVRAAHDMGHQGDWRAAIEDLKEMHVPPGRQAALVMQQSRDAIAFVDHRQLVTIPPLCRETWRYEMLSKRAQRTMPFAAYGGQNMLVAYPTHDMTHEAKVMTMRGNNIHFTRIVTPHELIPGHHLQRFYADRHNTHRRLFSTAFLVEGWALYWEMRLWELDYARGPEDRLGMLFWRKHRAARIIVSLEFHLGKMTPQEMIDFLMWRVGLEKEGATAEVRRYIGDGYGPLYQCAYMIGGLQLRTLHRDLVENGSMTERTFHDTVLRQNQIPLELIRAHLTGQPLTPDQKSQWRFYGDPSTPIYDRGQF